MLMCQPASRRTAEASRKALGPVGCFDLHAEGSQHVNTPGCPRSSILRPSGHRGGDIAVDEPVATFDLVRVSIPDAVSSIIEQPTYIVVVTTRTDAIDHEGADRLNAGECRGSHCDEN